MIGDYDYVKKADDKKLLDSEIITSPGATLLYGVV